MQHTTENLPERNHGDRRGPRRQGPARGDPNHDNRTGDNPDPDDPKRHDRAPRRRPLLMFPNSLFTPPARVAVSLARAHDLTFPATRPPLSIDAGGSPAARGVERVGVAREAFGGRARTPSLSTTPENAWFSHSPWAPESDGIIGTPPSRQLPAPRPSSGLVPHWAFFALWHPSRMLTRIVSRGCRTRRDRSAGAWPDGSDTRTRCSSPCSPRSRTRWSRR
jgi:hypothetical protein